MKRDSLHSKGLRANFHSPCPPSRNPVTRPRRAKPSLVYPHMSFCREERGRTDRRTDARTDGRTESATDQIFDLARKMDMDGHEWGKKFERCAGSQSCSSTISMKQPSSLPLPSTSLLLCSFQQCDYEEVNKNIRSAGVRPMTDEARDGKREKGEGEGRATTSHRLKNGQLLVAGWPAGRTPMSAVRLHNGPDRRADGS